MSEPTELARVVIAGHRRDLRTATEALNADDPDVRAAALAALDRMGRLEAGVLTTAAADPAPTVRRRVAELAAQHRSFDLVPLLDDDDPTVVEIAAWAAGEQVGDPADDIDDDTADDSVDGTADEQCDGQRHVSDDILDRLIRLTTDAADVIVRESAAAALGAIGDPRGLDAILRACRDKPAVRRRAVLALAPFLGEEVAKAAEADQASSEVGESDDDADGAVVDETVGMAATAAVEAALQAALTDRDWQVRQAADDLVRARRGGPW